MKLRDLARLTANSRLGHNPLILLLLALCCAWQALADDSNAIRLTSPRSLQVRFQGDAALASSHATPLALTADDFDMDGVGDLAAGYATPDGGRVAVFRGNLDAFAPQSEGSFWAIARTEFPLPFLPDAQVIGIPTQPDFLAAGMFIGHNGPSLVAATRGGNTIYVLAPDDSGQFQIQQTITLPGAITALGSPRKVGQYAQVVVGIRSEGGAALLVYAGSNEGLVPAQSIALTADATAFAFGDLDGDGLPDVLVIAGGAPSILYAGSESLKPVSVSFVATAAALGSFVYDRSSLLQMALLGDDGSVHILAHESFDPRVYSVAEMRARKKRNIEQAEAAMRLESIPQPHTRPAPESWKEIESFTAVALSPSPLLFRTRISDHAADDVLLLDGGRILVIAHPDSSESDAGDGSFPAGLILTQPEPYVGPVAALMERVNIDGRPGIILLTQGELAPSALMPLPDPTFTVNTTTDLVSANPNACKNAIAGQCSLRQAIIESNATAGTDTIMIPAGTYTLTLARLATDHHTSHQGTLEVQDSVNIVGAGQATTIIQAGTNAGNTGTPNGVDMVIAFNEDIDSFTNATVAVSNLTIQNGFNRGNTAIQDGDGGGFEFDTGTAGTANLTMTNVTVQNNGLNDGRGGGGALFNTNNGSGTATFTNCIIQNNNAHRNPADGVMDPNGAGTGGGLFIGFPATATLNTTQVLTNTATQVQGSGRGIGGGIQKTGGGNLNLPLIIHGGAISGNQSAGDAGGIFATSALTIDQGTVINGNTAGGGAGGIFVNSGNAGESATLTKVTITANNASGAAGAGTGNGGGVFVGAAGRPATITFSRFAGNLSQVAGHNNLVNQAAAPGSAVTATNNWWGTDDAKSTISPSTPTCPTPGAQQVCFDPFIVLTHMGSPQKIRINQSSTLTGDMSKDNHGTAISAANLGQIIGLPITFNGAVLGSIPQAQPETLNASAQATATFNAGGTSGFGTANATVDQAVVAVNSNLIASATESGSTATITTVGAHGFSAGEFVKISGVVVSGYNSSPSTQLFKILSTTTTTFTYTANSSGLGNSSGGTANAGIIILQPPTMTKSFNPTTVAKNTASTLTFTITNANVVPIDASFTDTLPAGLVVATTPSVSTTCGAVGTVTAAAGATSIVYSNPFTSPSTQPGNPTGTCTISVNVQSAVDNIYNNSVTLQSSDAGNAAAAATASLTVINPPHIVKAFGAVTIPLNGTTSLTFTIDSNTNANLTLNGVAFTDTLPAGLVNASPSNVSTTCSGGTATAADAGTSVSLSGASVAPNSSCTVTVTVKGTTGGTKANSVQVTSTNGLTGNTANATITVVVPPTISKAFNPSVSIPLNGIATLTFTITNPNNPATPALGDLTGVAFSDTLPSTTGTLVVAPNPNVSNTCGGTVTATTGTGTISLSGGSVAHNASCTLSVDVKGTAPGDAVNTTGAITSTEGGTGTTSNTATLKIVAPPTISKAFGAATIPLNSTTTLTFTITNPAANTTAESGIAFSDTLTNGLQVAGTPGVSNTCGGTVTAAANTTTISLSGGSIATPGNTCTLTVNVTGTQAGSVSNTTAAVSSTNGGTGATSNTATMVVVAPPTVTKSFAPTSVPLNGTSTLTINIQNPNSGTTLNGLAFTDSLPAGVQVAATPNASNTCGGTFAPASGNTTLTLSGGTLAASSSCAVSVSVVATTAGVKSNNVQVSSTEGGTSTTANATLTVIAPPTISKAFNPSTSIPLNGTAILTFTISNPNTTAAGDLTGLAFSDTLPNATGTLVVGPTPGVTNTCNGTVTAVAGSGTISLSGGSVAHNASCTITVTVQGTVAGDAANTTGAITSTEGGTGTTSNTATLKIVAPPTISKAFGAPSIQQNATTTVTFTITNPAANTTAESGIAFSDTLTNGLQVGSTPGVSNTCNGTVTAAANTTTISLSGGSIATPGNTCTITVNVTGTQPGTVSNTTGAVSSTNGGTGAASNTATLTVLAPATHFSVSAPSSATAGSAFNFTVTALDASNNTATGYTGTVHFTSSDGQSVLPANTTLTNGVGTFSATLKTAGNQTITATDTVTSSITGTSNTIAVSAAAATHFTVSAPASATAGSAFNFTVTALDQFNNTATGYGGTVLFTSSDGQAVLPANSTLASGVGTFSATLKTAGNQTITATDTVSSSITGTSNSIAVSAAAATHFTVSAPSTATANTAFNFTVTAQDQFNNTATTYAGTVHFTSTDAQAVLPANSTLTSGTGTFSATLKTAGNQTITATDTVSSSITGTSNTITVGGAPATHFTVSAPASATAGSAFNFTVTALDASNNTATGYTGTVHFTSSDGQAVLPANTTLTNGTGTFSATLKTAGNQTITATDTVSSSITGTSNSIAVSAAAATHFTVSAPGSATAGSALNFTVTAQDQFNNTSTGYGGTVHFTSSDGQATLPANSTLSSGVGTFSATLKTAGSQTITATDTVTSSITGTSGTITVSPTSATHFAVSAPGTATANVAFNFTVTAQDQFNNTATSYGGTVHFTSSDAQAVLPANSTLTNGAGTFSATLKTSGNQTITATDTVTSSITGTSNTITVGGAAATHFTVSAPSSATAGSAFNFTVTALDASNNTATGYTGTVHFTSSDGQAVLPANTTLTNGTGTFSATLKTAGNQTITATDTVTSSITGTSNSIAVSAAAATHYSVSAPASATAGSAFNFTVTAQDQFNNTSTGYAGTVHFTSSDAQATLAANSTLSNGTGTFSATLKTAGNQTITATDTVSSSITGTSNSIAVSAAAATHFAVSAPSSATANTAFNFTVTAQDQFNNTATAYAGTVHFTSSDAQAVLPANSTLTNGTGTFSATLKTTGNQTITATDTVSSSITGTSNTINVGAAALPDLTVGKTHHPSTFTVNDVNDTIPITVTNIGNAASSGTVTVTDTLPAGLTFNGSPTAGWVCNANGSNPVVCTTTNAISGSGGTSAVVLNVNVASSTGSPLTNNVSVACTCTESSTGNNTGTDSIPVNQTVGLTLATASPTGLQVSADGGANFFAAPHTFQLAPGSTPTIVTQSPQSGGAGTQFVWVSWSDGGAISHQITVPSSPTTYTATFKTQFLLTTQVSPSASAGSILPATGFFDSGSVVSVSATANTGYVFTGFTGALSGTTNPQNITMNAPATVTANFGPGPTSLGGSFGTKTGPIGGQRVWTVNIGNNGPGVALNAQVTSFTVVQTSGAACTPVVVSAMPVSAGDIAPGGTAPANVTIGFTGCPSNAFFHLTANLSANSGAATGQIDRLNQLQ